MVLGFVEELVQQRWREVDHLARGNLGQVDVQCGSQRPRSVARGQQLQRLADDRNLVPLAAAGNALPNHLGGLGVDPDVHRRFLSSTLKMLAAANCGRLYPPS